MKSVFEAVADGVYYLRVPYGEQEAGITLIKGNDRKATVLIDTGSQADTVREYLIPALRAMDMSLRDIGSVTVTHTHTDNIVGLHRLKKEAPDIRIIVPQGCADRVQNPMYYIMAEREVFPEHNPPFEEVFGVLVDGDVEPYGLYAGLRMIPASGHDEDCVCWLHEASGTLIVGDVLQGNGNAMQGAPYYKNISSYLATLTELEGMADKVKHLISSHTMDGLKAVEHGSEKLTDVIRRCRECVTDMGNLVQDQLDMGVTDIATVAANISMKNFDRMPPALCYAMYSVSAHIKEGVLREVDTL